MDAHGYWCNNCSCTTRHGEYHHDQGSERYCKRCGFQFGRQVNA